MALPFAGLSAEASHGLASRRQALASGEPMAAAAAPEASMSADTAARASAAVPTPGSPAAPVHLPLLNVATGDPGTATPPRPGFQISVPAVGLRVGVVDYGDCAGNTAMTRVSAVHFLCAPSAVTTFVGHNPGVFTPLLRTQPGDRVYYSHDGVQDAWVISARYRVSPQDAAGYTQDGSYPHAVFATCAEPDSSAYWIFIATPVGGTAPAVSSGRQTQPSNAPSGSGRPRPAPSPSPSPTPAGGLPGVPIPPPPI